MRRMRYAHDEYATEELNLFSFPFDSVWFLSGVIVWKKQPAWPQLPGEAVFLTSAT